MCLLDFPQDGQMAVSLVATAVMVSISPARVPAESQNQGAEREYVSLLFYEAECILSTEDGEDLKYFILSGQPPRDPALRPACERRRYWDRSTECGNGPDQ